MKAREQLPHAIIGFWCHKKGDELTVLHLNTDDECIIFDLGEDALSATMCSYTLALQVTPNLTVQSVLIVTPVGELQRSGSGENIVVPFEMQYDGHALASSEAMGVAISPDGSLSITIVSETGEIDHTLTYESISEVDVTAIFKMRYPNWTD